MRKIDIIAGEILSKFNSWQDDRREKQDTWVKYSRVARLQEDSADKQRESEGSRLKMPTTKSAITMAMDNLYQMFFGSDQFFDIKGRTVEDNPDVLKVYLKYLLEKDKVKLKFKRFLYDLCTYGTGICRINIKTDFNKKMSFSKNFFNFKRVLDFKVKEVNRPEFEWINIFDFFIEPQSTDIQSSEGVIVRKVQKIYKLRSLESQGVLSGVKHIKSNMPLDDDKRHMLQKAGINAELNSDDITLFEYWGWLDADLLKKAGYEGNIVNGGAEVVVEVANGQTVLKLTPNPFFTQERPFLKENFEEIPGEFYGLGICDISDGPQRALDATVRSRIDNKRIAINQVFAVNIHRVVIDSDGKIFPGKTYFTEGNPREIIQQMQIADVTGGSYIEAQEFERYIHEATGISPILAGMTGSKSQTATEASIAQNQSNVRLRMIALQVEENVLKEILRWFYQIVLQFLDSEEIIKVTDRDIFERDTVKITRESIIGDYDFIPMGIMSMTARNNFTKIVDFLTRTANQFDVQVTDRAYLLKEAYKALGFNDADRVFKVNNSVGQEMLKSASGVKGVGSPPGETSNIPDINTVLNKNLNG